MRMMNNIYMKKYIILEKKVGETPLSCTERFKANHPKYKNAKMAYAGRLDPMASGKLLILLENECKKQKDYHVLDKEYIVEIILGLSSDTGDVLGLLTESKTKEKSIVEIKKVLKKFIGEFVAPYPIFSSRTVKGKPLHTWTLEDRLNEIEIPTSTSIIYNLKLTDLSMISIDSLYACATEKIESIPKVTDIRKTLGNDFRRPLIRDSWKTFHESSTTNTFQILTVRCIASSGTYMRTLAEHIGEKLGTCALALSIHRSKIGTYKKIPLLTNGYWTKLL